MNKSNKTKNILNSLIFIKSCHGFTLIELLVVIVMLGVLLTGLILAINPVAQYNKTKDGQREHDLGQIRNALDAYYNDTHCYPQTLTFGSGWSANGATYMVKVPQDPDNLTSSGQIYFYQTDGSSCPQWNVLYASLKSAAIPSDACSLSKRSNPSCVPVDYASSGYNYCIPSGTANCSYIASSRVGSATPGGGGGGGGGNPTATPTPTSGVIFCPSGQYFGCTGDNRCNSIAPVTQCVGHGGNITCYCDQHCNQSCAFN